MPAQELPYWSRSAEALIAHLSTSGERGLSEDEASRRLQRDGPNELVAPRGALTLRLLWKQIANPLLAILVVAAVISAIAGEWPDAIIVLTIAVLSVAISFWREHSSGRALKALAERLTLEVAVVRDGRTVRVPARLLVSGDIVALTSGSLVPADGVLLFARDLFVSEAVLTGESFPVEKRVGAAPPTAVIGERAGALYLGTHVRSGFGRMLVVRTGRATEYGGISERLKLRPPETDFDHGLKSFGYTLTVAMLLISFVVLAVNILFGKPALESLLFSVALAVGLTPELLPAILSVNLSRSATAMAGSGVLVRRLNAIENLGSMDILCTDKTGTLTEGAVQLDRALDEEGRVSERVHALAWLNARLQEGVANPLDAAIVASRAPRDIEGLKIAEIPYDFVRRRLGVVVREDNAPLLIVKGALANILDVCSDMPAERREALERRLDAWSVDGYRVLGVGSRALPVKDRYDRDDECDLTFAGFLLFRDPPKAGVTAALAELKNLHVSLKVISGDNAHVARHVCTAIGLPAERVLTGHELDELGDEALWHAAEKVDIFAEVDPNQKERIILALKKTGHVVGYMGDGINDAPALHAADVSVSVEGAVDVAREAADFVLLEHDLSVLARGVRHGRTTFANTLKYILTTESANLGNMLSMAAASLWLPFLPLLAGQILLNNLLSDIPAFALARDRVDDDWIASPRRWDLRAIRRFMIAFGLLSSLFDFLTFFVLLYGVRASAEVFHTGWFVESLLTELLVALVVRTAHPFYASKPSRGLVLATAAIVAIALALPYVPTVSSALGFVPLPWWLLLGIVGITLVYIAAVELLKARFVTLRYR